MVTALATMFKLAVQRGWMLSNPATGIAHAYKPDRNANREWRPEEWVAVMERAALSAHRLHDRAPHWLPLAIHRRPEVLELSGGRQVRHVLPDEAPQERRGKPVAAGLAGPARLPGRPHSPNIAVRYNGMA
jgi:hypothetical protein